MALSKVDLETCRNECYIVDPFSDKLLTPLGYDLSPGYVVLVPDSPDEEAEVLFSSSDTEELGTAKQESFTIPGHRGVMLITRENVCLTGKLLATLHGRSRVTQEGVVVNPVTVDPNWSGRLILYFYNTSRRGVDVSTKGGIATLIFHAVESMTTQKPGSSTTRALLENSRLDERILQKLLAYVNGLTNTLRKRRTKEGLRNCSVGFMWSTRSPRNRRDCRESSTTSASASSSDAVGSRSLSCCWSPWRSPSGFRSCFPKSRRSWETGLSPLA